ncbi:hypothetical protein HRR83_000578 [Exophiala dermatitidis]|uniref:NADH dehydrogenase n=2 Tax=Exophiala dermatitidis TaxID=5970 RepID=H6CA01_EXODN|nr:NADH dehydrogenase [Exophiala dermatitidis NIH/UT8656]KAJ4527825.1 hypothetical protein HRR74_000580 [Exophiala dermatitidis]EHY60812.1 NADH dehydrogenase [Exophiala dermatitidis NIH/UT8656]KAJ4528460.1 hypothetical protein HRR73_001083 [Exophiala dermatitidis]KAJ4531422.1 hypothetical protein HRR76_009078 [Exophiala dermatitidis]KAJ4558583.1 hypothetical protein HRR77_000578 [Exophiala dermatitidis]
MPTPESEAFLAKKPKVPPTFQGVDFSDNQAVTDARDAIVREQWVQQMMQRLVGEEMGKCYKREGVNHLEKCGKYRERYLQLLKGNKEKGYRGRQQNYVPGVDGPAGGPEIQTTYPTAQQAKGAKGSDYRPGNTTGNGGDVLY